MKQSSRVVSVDGRPVDPNQCSWKRLRFTQKMGVFNIFFVDHAGHVLRVEEGEAANDQDAIEQTLRRFQWGADEGLEIWQDNRRVYANFKSRLSHH